MTDVDTGPSSLDVFEHAMLTLTKEPDRYNGRVIVGTPDWHDPRFASPVPVEDVYDGDADAYLRCFVGQAVVRAPEFLGRRIVVDKYASYWEIAQAYDVPLVLVRIIGDGVNGWAFSTAVKFVRRVLKAYRQGGIEAAQEVPWPHRRGQDREQEENHRYDGP